MNLNDFPRPPNDNGIGVHWSMSPYPDSQGVNDWGYWSELLLTLGIKWVKVIDDGGGSAAKLVRRLVRLKIMPVVRFYWPEQNSADNTSGLLGSRGGDAVRRYIDEGAVYFETNNEPDLDLEWKKRKKPTNWLDIVVTNFIADADMVIRAGGFPGVPAFGVGTLRNPFQAIVDAGRKDILDNGAWAPIHNYALGRPLEYPNDPVNLYGEPLTQEGWEAAGGIWAWEMGVEAVNKARREGAKPDATIESDATCFRAFEQVNKYVVAACGHSIPIMMTEGGYNVGQRGGTTFGDDARYPKPTPDATSKLTIDMFKYMQGEVPILGKKVPDYYFSSMPWLIANYRIGVWQPPCEAQGPWITDFFNEVWGLNGELPLVQILKGLPKKIRHYGNPPKVWGVQRPSDALGTAWDESLTYVGIELAPCMNKDKPYWKLISAKRVENAGVVGIFVCCRDKNGNPIEGQSFFACRGEGNARVCDYAQTKGAVDGYWGNIPSFAMLGTYTTGVSKDKSQSNTDLVVGLGCGTETIGNAYIPTQFRLEFQYTEPSGTNVVGIDGRILDAANMAFKALGAASDIIHNIMFAEKE